MKANKKLSFLLTLMLVIYSLCGNLVNAAPTSSIEIVLDKTTASVGEIVTASINVKDVNNFSGYQVNLKYDPLVLQPVTSSGIGYTNSTMPEAGTILNNDDFGPKSLAKNVIEKGILNFSEYYLNMDEYRAAGTPEKTGTVAVIKFKVLKAEVSSISFQDTEVLTNAINGTVLFDWNGNRITSAYNVGQAQLVNFNEKESSYITMDFDKSTAEVGDIITATLKVNKIANIAGCQVNIKYDPTVLQAVDPIKESAYGIKTRPISGELLTESDYGPSSQADHKITEGILNFGIFYTDVELYKESGTSKDTGSVAIVGFKVLQKKATSVLFEGAETMPNGITGTTLINWDGNRIASGYSVIQPKEINSELNPTPTPENYITMDFDKSTAEVGDIITATLKVNKIANIAGCQVNIKYDPTVLQAVDPIKGSAYGIKTRPISGELLTESDYGPSSQADHKITEGILNFGIFYTDVELYKESGTAKDTGSVAIVGFKVLQKKATSVLFEDAETMPNGITGTTLINWDGNRIASGYSVVQPKEINSEISATPTVTVAPTATPTATVAPTATPTAKVTATVVPTATPTVTVTATVAPTATPTAKVTATVAPTATPTAKVTATVAPTATPTAKVTATVEPTATPTATPTAKVTATVEPTATPTAKVTATVAPTATPTPATEDSYITIDLDKTAVSVGDTIKAIVRINNIDNFAGYQVNIEYDPTVLQAVNASDGLAYTNSSLPQDGDLLVKEYGQYPIAKSKISNGILNFSKIYTELAEYRAANEPEESGTIFVVGFKVLQAKETTIAFADCEEMPDGITGTMLFDWNGDKIRTGYSVKQPSKISISPTETPDFIYGDVDGNGYIWINDYVIIRDYVLGKITAFTPKYGYLAADVDGDGKIMSNDAILVRDHVLGKIKSFPAEEKR